MARLFVPLPDFLFLAPRGMVLINVWRTKRSYVEQHNTNSSFEKGCRAWFNFASVSKLWPLF